jgi:hypothetical protein
MNRVFELGGRIIGLEYGRVAEQQDMLQKIDGAPILLASSRRQVETR